jgi:hypothetical protein
MTDSETSKYKYIIDVEGHVAAFRLGRMFSFGSLILKIDSEWKLWFSDIIDGAYYEDIDAEKIHYIQYIKIRTIDNRIDEKHLKDTIHWCIKNDKYCKKIAENGLFFHKTLINKYGIFYYMKQLLNSEARQ